MTQDSTLYMRARTLYIMYTVVTLPRLDPQLGAFDQGTVPLGQQYRDFRLLALKTSPGAFAASYDDEVKRGLDHTFERLANPKATQFVALRREGASSSDRVVEASLTDAAGTEWHGFIGLFGPLDDNLEHVSAVTDPFVQMTAHASGHAAKRTETEQSNPSGPMRFHLNGMFVSPAARGFGLGKRLIDAALDKAGLDAREAGRNAQCTILLDEWNTAAKNLYEKAGFQVIGHERYTNNAKRLPEGETAEDERVALRMQAMR